MSVKKKKLAAFCNIFCMATTVCANSYHCYHWQTMPVDLYQKLFVTSWWSWIWIDLLRSCWWWHKDDVEVATKSKALLRGLFPMKISIGPLLHAFFCVALKSFLSLVVAWVWCSLVFFRSHGYFFPQLCVVVLLYHIVCIPQQCSKIRYND